MVATAASAQEKGFQSNFDFSFDMLGRPSSEDYDFEGSWMNAERIIYTAGYRVNHSHFIGLGFGFSLYNLNIYGYGSFPSFPILLDYRAYFKEKNNFSLLLDTTFGPAINFRGDWDNKSRDYYVDEETSVASRVSLSMALKFGFNYRLVNKLSLVGMFGLQVRGGDDTGGLKKGEWSLGPSVQIGISF